MFARDSGYKYSNARLYLQKEGDEEKPLHIPTVNEMNDINRWLHLNPSILQQGRVKHADPKSDDPEADPE